VANAAAKAEAAGKLDAGHHDRRLARRMEEDLEFRTEFERARREVAAIHDLAPSSDGSGRDGGGSVAVTTRAVRMRIVRRVRP